MPRPDTLALLESAIRNAVATDSFAETERLFARYVAEVERLWKSLPAGSEERLALPGRTRILCEWSNAMMLASREYAAAELAQAQLISQYREYSNALQVRAEG